MNQTTEQKLKDILASDCPDTGILDLSDINNIVEALKVKSLYVPIKSRSFKDILKIQEEYQRLTRVIDWVSFDVIRLRHPNYCTIVFDNFRIFEDVIEVDFKFNTHLNGPMIPESITFPTGYLRLESLQITEAESEIMKSKKDSHEHYVRLKREYERLREIFE